MEYLIRNNNGTEEVAVLITKNFGYGWSTCQDTVSFDSTLLALDKRIIEYFLTKPSSEEMESYLISLGYTNVCMLGYEHLEVDWVKKGTVFRICYCDGVEVMEKLIYGTF